MGKLENIPKKNIFDVPEGYFDKLPGIVQARVTTRHKVSPQYTPAAFALRFVLPVVVVIVTALFVFRGPAEPMTPEQMLASLDTNDLVNYLEQSDLTTDELLDQIDYRGFDVNAVEVEVITIPSEDLKEVNDELNMQLDF